jgi:hypothetical protein
MDNKAALKAARADKPVSGKGMAANNRTPVRRATSSKIRKAARARVVVIEADVRVAGKVGCMENHVNYARGIAPGVVVKGV